jgi:hypothetical protein
MATAGIVIDVAVVIDNIVTFARTAATTVAMIRAGAVQDGGFMPALSSGVRQCVNLRGVWVVS